MTVEWFDLGQRLRAARTQQSVPRLAHAAITATLSPVACRAWVADEQVTVTAASPDQAPRTATGPAALDLLGTLGVTLAAPTPATLVTDQPRTLSLLRHLASTARHDSDLDTVAAHVGWWLDRADFPGGAAVVDTLAACRTRWTTGTTPTAERDPETWRSWLGVPDDSARGLLTIHESLTTGPALQWLDLLAEDNTWTYGAAQTSHGDGFDWRRPDSTSRAALGLRSRCDAADLYAAALLTDPLYRRRAIHTGHVISGTAHPLSDKLRRIEVTCPRLDARLRPGNDVTGWTTDPANRFTATVSDATVHDGHLVLTLTGSTGTTPSDERPVTLMPTAPSPQRQRAGRRAYRALYRARRSWLTTGRTPTLSRRVVPLDVLVAGAELE